jgi:adenine-specific DNA-methyltransferase
LLIAKGKELNGQYKGDELHHVWKQWFKENKSQLGKLDRYKYIDEGGIYTGSQRVHNPGKEGYRYDIIHPETGKPCKQPLMGYRFPKTSMHEMIDEGRILFGKDETKLVEIKLYAHEYQDKLSSVYVSDSRTGANELRDLFPEHKQIFKNPKSTDLIEHILSYIDVGDKYIVDFFGGSSTTAQAIMQMNKSDDKKRKYILVQLPEEIAEDKEAYKAGYRTIDQIGQERIKRAAKKIKAENPLFAGDLGFKHYTLKEVPENVLDKMEEFNPEEASFGGNMLELFGRETVLTTWKVRDGYGLTSEVEEVQLADYTAYQCGDHLYLLDEGLSDDAITAMVDKYGEPTPWNPHHVVLFGYNMNFGVQDALRTNLPLLNEGEKQIRINIDVRY